MGPWASSIKGCKYGFMAYGIKKPDVGWGCPQEARYLEGLGEGLDSYIL